MRVDEFSSQHFSVEEFAKWLDERSRNFGTDLWLPVETKGARLLDIAIEAARKRLNVQIGGTVIYRHALDFMSDEQLAERRVTIVDDATRTSRALHRSYEVLSKARRNKGSFPTQVLASLGTRDASRSERARQLGVEYFFEAKSPGDYDRRVYDMARSILVQPGTPEVDHITLAVTLTAPPAEAVLAIKSRLESIGEVRMCVDPQTQIASLTLDLTSQPELFGLLQRDAVIHAEGIIKLKVFCDLRTNELRLTPMAFPNVCIPIDDLPEYEQSYSAGVSRSFAEWGKDRWTTPGDLVLASVQPHVSGAMALFRAAQLTLDAALLDLAARSIRDAGLDLRVRATNSTIRLYGPDLGPTLASVIVQRFHGELSRPRNAQTPVDPQFHLAESLGGSVSRDAVRDASLIVAYLSREADEHNEGVVEPGDREQFGDSFSGIKRYFRDRHGHHTRPLSEALDFALGTLSVTPYIDERQADDRLTIRRCYRVTETPSAVRNARDSAAEIIAGIAYHLERFEISWSEGVDVRTMSHLFAVLEPIFERQVIPLSVGEGETGPTVQLRLGSVAMPRIDDVFLMTENPYFYLEDQRIRWSPAFKSKYEAGELDIMRGPSPLLGDLETSLGSIGRICLAFEESSGQSRNVLLESWALVAGGDYGMNYVGEVLHLALEALRVPIAQHWAGRSLRREQLRGPADKARRLAANARGLISALGQLQEITIHLPDRTTVTFTERSLLDRFAPPANALPYLVLLERAASTVETAAQVAESLPSVAPVTGHQPSLLDALADQRSATDFLGAVTRLAHIALVGADRSKRLRLVGAPSEAEDLSEVLCRAIDSLMVWVACLAARSQPASSLCSVNQVERRGVTARLAVLSGDVRDSTDLSASQLSAVKVLTRSAVAAFGGTWLKTSDGDDVLAGFRHVEPALICAMIIQYQLGLRTHDPVSARRSVEIRFVVDLNDVQFDSRGECVDPTVSRAFKLVSNAPFKGQADCNRIYLSSDALDSSQGLLAKDNDDMVELTVPDGPSSHFVTTLLGVPRGTVLTRYSALLDGAVGRGRTSVMEAASLDKGSA